jgi:hypothetical protein
VKVKPVDKQNAVLHNCSMRKILTMLLASGFLAQAHAGSPGDTFTVIHYLHDKKGRIAKGSWEVTVTVRYL